MRFGFSMASPLELKVCYQTEQQTGWERSAFVLLQVSLVK